MKTIPLTRGLEAIVDDCDFEWLSQLSWQASPSSTGKCYARRGGPRSPRLRMHRVIMGAGKTEWVDHINGDTLDNRRGNLRFADPEKNSCNAGIRRDNTTGFKGVTYRAKYNKYSAAIKFRGVTYNLGQHETPEQAHAAYCAKAKELHGEYANFG